MRLLFRLLIVLVICVVAIAIPAAPAQADSEGPSITLSPSSGVPGRDITVYGSNFTHGAWVDIYYYWTSTNSTVVAEVDHTDDAGDFEVTFTVPESYKGLHRVLATDASNKSYSANFTVKPGLTVNPEDGPVGANATVEGQGFAEDEGSIELRYYLGSSYETVVQNIQADENGSWEKVFLVPSSARGAHRIDATGESSAASAVHDTTFEVTPAISLAQPSGSPGENVTMTGNGFYANDRYITILFEGEEAETEIIRADDNGYWEGNFEVPEMPIGTYNVTAEGELTAEGDLTAISFEIKPGLVLSPNEGHVGTELTVTGYGFPDNEDVDVMYDGSQMQTAETNDHGSFEISFAVPESQHGEHNVTAGDVAGNNATANFTMESAPPGTPELVSPSNGSRVGFIGRLVRPTFNWSAVSDESGVYYSLQIATSANVTVSGFINPVVSVTGIVGTNYTLNTTQTLPYGTYYWIVRAVDGAGNAGNWTAAYSFHAGIMPLWAFILIIVAVVAVIGAAVYFFIIRKRIYYY
jgi:IPT/TIG domain